MADFHIKALDQLPVLSATLENGAGEAVSLAGVQGVRFLMRAMRGATSPKVNGAASVDDAIAGKVHYDWQSSDTDTPGGYRGEWLVTFSDGRSERFPNNRSLTVAVHERLDPV